MARRKRRKRKERRGQLLDGGHPRDPGLFDLFNFPRIHSGVTVTEDTALNFSAVWCAVRAISEAVASLPLIVYRRMPGGGKQRDTDHPLYSILHDRPNPENSAFNFIESRMAHVLLYGNAYAEIQRNRAGRPVALWPIHPRRVRVRRENGLVVYHVSRGDGSVDVVPQMDMFHLAGLGDDPLVGLSVIAKARETIGLGIAAERFGAAFFGRGATSTVVLKFPGSLRKPGSKERLMREWRDFYSGQKGMHGALILEEGMTVEPLTMPLDDAQFLATRRFEVEEIARWFNLPVHKLKELSNSNTRANVEQQRMEFAEDTVRPWLVRWEQEIQWKLFDEGERRNWFAEFLMDALLRADLRSRFEAYRIAVGWGIMTRDEVREKENLSPLANDAGRQVFVPLNTQPIEAALGAGDGST